MKNKNNYSKLSFLFSLGCIFIFSSLIALILFPYLEILKPSLTIISGSLLFIFGFLMVITAVFLLKKDSTEKREPYVYVQNQNQELFPLRTILISITALNVILFVGGTIWSGVKIYSIQERYNEVIKATSDVMEKVNDAIEEERFDVEQAKKKAIGKKDVLDKNDSIEKMVQDVLNAKNNAIEGEKDSIQVYVKEVKKAKIDAIDGSGEKEG